MPLITKTNAQTGEISFQLPSGQALFTQPPLDARLQHTISAVYFRVAADELGNFSEKAADIKIDRLLSDEGRRAKLEPLEGDLVKAFAHVGQGMLDEAARFDRMEAEFSVLPKLDPTHTALAIESREMRDWFRAQSMEARAEVLKSIEAQPDGNEMLMLALLRSPVPIALDHELKWARDIWRAMKRRADPAKALEIDDGREAWNWAHRGMLQAVGIAPSVTGISRADMLQRLVAVEAEKPALYFTYTATDIERAKRAAEYEKRTGTKAALILA